MDSYVVAIDQGTTGSHVLVFEHAGHVLGRAYSEFPQIYPKPGWVEHDAEVIWEVTRKVYQQALHDNSIDPEQIASIGITNQRETTILWDRKTGKPVHNAIVWQCRRTAAMCNELRKQGKADMIQERTGLVLDAYFSGTKLKWLLDNVPGAREKAKAGDLLFGTIDTWLVWKLTGGRSHVTDYTNASRTLLYNIHERKWDEEIMDLLGIPAALLPEVKPSSGLFGHTMTDKPFGREIPIAGIAGDQQAALFGQGCWDRGMVKITYGTGAFLLEFTGEEAVRSKEGLLTTMACAADGGPAYALEGSVFMAGAAVQWLRDELRVLETARESEKIATSIADTGGVYVVPAFVGLGTPHWDMDARGAVLGMTRGSGRPQIIRATLESIAYQCMDVVEVMTRESGTTIKEMRVDGGASANNFLMQFQSDVLRADVNRPVMVDTTATGAAFLAGLGVGFWKDAKELGQARRTDKVFSPKMDQADRDHLCKGWKEAVSRVLTKG